MRLNKIIFTIIVCSTIYSCSNPDNDILQNTVNKIQRLETVNYQFNVKEFDSYSGQLNSENSYTAFFDINKSDTIFGAHYLISNKKGVEAYNGFSTFYANNKILELIYSKVYSTDDLYGLGYFSITELGSLIPEMLNDTSIFVNRLSDTIINKKSCYQYGIRMHKKSIGYNGKIVQDKYSLNTTDRNGDSHYQLIINKKDNLPEQFIVFSYHMTPFKIITYKEYNLSPKFDPKRLDYSLGYPNFKLKNSIDLFKEQRIDDPAINTKAKDWILPSIHGDSIQLSQIKSKLTLLEFWFPGCSGCAIAIPHLNEIQKKYKHKGIKVFGIEYTNTDSANVSAYIKKMNIEFPTLYSAKKMAKAYEVYLAPTYFLINNQGIVVYKSMGFNKDDLINEIELNL